jgi:transcriptional regulator with XRE-family HTH domain
MSIHDERYRRLIERLVQARKRLKLSQDAVAKRLVLDPRRPEKRYLQSFVSKVETRERRLDAIELAEFARVYCTSVSELLGETLALGGAGLACEGDLTMGASVSTEDDSTLSSSPEEPEPSEPPPARRPERPARPRRRP